MQSRRRARKSVSPCAAQLDWLEERVLLNGAPVLDPGTPGPAEQAQANEVRLFRARLSGDQEVPPRETDAVGKATLRLNRDGDLFKVKIRLKRLENLSFIGLSHGAEGENGPLVVTILGGVGNGGPDGKPPRRIVGKTTFTGEFLQGPLEGQPLSALVNLLRQGQVYINVHTSDRQPPENTGPGDFSDGEIRGQFPATSGPVTAGIDRLFARVPDASLLESFRASASLRSKPGAGLYKTERGTPGDDIQDTLGTPDNDRIKQLGRGGNNSQFIGGDSGHDRLQQTSGKGSDKQTIHAGPGNDTILQKGGNGDDTLLAEDDAGDDTVVQKAGGGNDSLGVLGGSGNDRIELDGGDGDDSILASGGDGSDDLQISGNLGNDTIICGVVSGNDTVQIDGGQGDDNVTVRILSSSNVQILDARGNVLYQQGMMSGSTVTVYNIEHLSVVIDDDDPIVIFGATRAGRLRTSVRRVAPVDHQPVALIMGGTGS